MNDEIKEMLDLINELVKISPNKGRYGISHKKWKQLLDYITNLQQQLHQASLDIQELTERDIECPSWCDKLTNLQQENQEMKTNTIPTLEHNIDALVDEVDELEDYKSRCEKAIQIIKTKYPVLCESEGNFKEELLNILQNGSEKDG